MSTQASGPLDPEDEILLEGGNVGRVVRVGATVRRTAGPWTPTVQSLLGFLAESGFEPAPRPMGTDEGGREVVSYIEGQTWGSGLPASVWLGSLEESARLLRRYHDLSAHYAVPAGAIWRDHPDDSGPSEVICHSDWGPYNAVWSDGRLVGIIDWDFARPGSRLFDIAWMALTWCPLTPPEKMQEGLPTEKEQPGRLRQLCDAYGLEDRGALVEMIHYRANPQWIQEGVEVGDPVRLKMAEDGHLEHWLLTTRHVERISGALERALR